jgi:hypothetical protein
MEGIYEKLKRLVEAMDLKGIEQYYTDPKTTASSNSNPNNRPIRTAIPKGSVIKARSTRSRDRSRHDRRRKGHYHRRECSRRPH